MTIVEAAGLVLTIIVVAAIWLATDWLSGE